MLPVLKSHDHDYDYGHSRRAKRITSAGWIYVKYYYWRQQFPPYRPELHRLSFLSTLSTVPRRNFRTAGLRTGTAGRSCRATVRLRTGNHFARAPYSFRCRHRIITSESRSACTPRNSGNANRYCSWLFPFRKCRKSKHFNKNFQQQNYK